jgi:phosphatidylglycerol lysyltransferase
MLVALVPATIFFVASASADLVAVVGHDPIGIWSILPAGPVAGGWLNDELSSTALLMVAIVLYRAKQAGFWLALASLSGAFVVQGLLHHHPVAAVLALVAAGILIATRDRYDVEAGRSEVRIAICLMVLAAIAASVATLIDGPLRTELPRFGRLVGMWIDGGTIGRLRAVTGVTAGLLFARVAFVGAMALILGPAHDPSTAADFERARRTLRAVGRGPLLPYKDDPLVSPFTDGDHDAAIAFARAGRTAVMLGDPDGETSAGLPVAEAWIERARRLDWLPVVYQASRRFAAELGSRGWSACQIGAEAVVDPVAFDLRSPRLANVRHTVERSRKAGIDVRSSWDDGGLPRTTIDELAALDAEWQRAAGLGLGFTVGRFDAASLAGALTVVAADAAREPQAFVVLRPTGADGGWMLDIMRRRRAAAPGTVEACLVEAIHLLADHAVHRLSLGLAPLAGLDPKRGSVPERGLAVLARLIRPAYDVKGLAFFKDKFGPDWEPRYLVVRHPWVLGGAAMALLRLHLGGSWPRVIRSLARPGTPSPTRAT